MSACAASLLVVRVAPTQPLSTIFVTDPQFGQVNLQLDTTVIPNFVRDYVDFVAIVQRNPLPDITDSGLVYRVSPVVQYYVFDRISRPITGLGVKVPLRPFAPFPVPLRHILTRRPCNIHTSPEAHTIQQHANWQTCSILLFTPTQSRRVFSFVACSHSVVVLAMNSVWAMGISPEKSEEEDKDVANTSEKVTECGIVEASQSRRNCDGLGTRKRGRS